MLSFCESRRRFGKVYRRTTCLLSRRLQVIFLISGFFTSSVIPLEDFFKVESSFSFLGVDFFFLELLDLLDVDYFASPDLKLTMVFFSLLELIFYLLIVLTAL